MKNLPPKNSYEDALPIGTICITLTDILLVGKIKVISSNGIERIEVGISSFPIDKNVLVTIVSRDINFYRIEPKTI